MKKLTALFLTLAMAFCLCACGGGGSEGGSDTENKDDSQSESVEYNLDKTSTEEQPMGEEMLTKEEISKTCGEFFRGYTMFDLDENYSKLTYEDIRDVFGVDANSYHYDEDVGGDCYTWQASDAENSRLCIWFRDGHLYSLGSANLNTMDYIPDDAG